MTDGEFQAEEGGELLESKADWDTSWDMRHHNEEEKQASGH